MPVKKILYVGSEIMPFAATGGLGDVMGSLPAAVKTKKSRGRYPCGHAALQQDSDSIPGKDDLFGADDRSAIMAAAVLRDFFLGKGRGSRTIFSTMNIILTEEHSTGNMTMPSALPFSPWRR